MRTMSLRPHALLGSMLVVLMTLTVLPTTHAGAQQPDPVMPRTVADLVPSEGALLGAWAKPQEGWQRTHQEDAFDSIERAAGRTLDVAHVYYPWEDAFPTWKEQYHLDAGRTPLINWNGTQTSEVASGRLDAVIRDRARGVKSINAPVFLRWFWEMDAGGSRAAVAESPANYIAAWRHIHNVFAAEGVTNVAWVWCPNAYAFTTGTAQQFYPGDEYVDWICADGYNWNQGRDGAAWRTITEIYRDFHAWAATRGKPLMIGETGVIERNAGEKATWLRQIPELMARDLPAVKAIMYFHSDTIYPWWLDSSTSALQGWNDMATHPYLNTRTGATATSEPAPAAGGPTAGSPGHFRRSP